MSNHRDHRDAYVYQSYETVYQEVNGTSSGAIVDHIAQEGAVSLRAVQSFTNVAQNFPQIGIQTAPNGSHGQRGNQNALFGTKFRHWLASRNGSGMKVSATSQTNIVAFPNRADAETTSAQQSSDRSPKQKDFAPKKPKARNNGNWA